MDDELLVEAYEAAEDVLVDLSTHVLNEIRHVVESVVEETSEDHIHFLMMTILGGSLHMLTERELGEDNIPTMENIYARLGVLLEKELES